MVRKQEPRTCVIYCRTSSRQQRDAETIQAQIKKCEALVKAHGLTPIAYGPISNNPKHQKGPGWLIDDGISGSLLDGRALSTLIDDIRAGKVHPDVLVTSTMSRLSRPDKDAKDLEQVIRSQEDAARIRAVLMARKVLILDSDGVQDAGSIVTEIKSALSAEEYRLIRARTMSGKARVGAAGYRPSGGRYMFGYRAVRVGGASGGMNQEPDPVTAPRLRSIMKAYAEGGAAHAARWAMEKKIPAPYGGKNWNASQVYLLVKRIDAYATGENTVTVDGQPYTYKFEPIVPKDLYRAVVTRQKESKVTPRAVMMTTGYATCAHCGDNVVAQKSVKQAYYYLTCKTASRDGRGACLRLREDILGPRIWDAVVLRLVSILEAEAPKAGKDTTGPRLKEAEVKALKNKQAMERLLELYEGGDIDKGLLHARMAKLKTLGREIDHEIETLKRAKRAQEAKRGDEDATKTRIQRVLRLVLRGKPNTEQKRQVIRDLLRGERMVLGHVEPRTPRQGILTLPSFGSLKPVKVRLDRDVTPQLHGVSREVLDVIYDVEDAVEDVAM